MNEPIEGNPVFTYRAGFRRVAGIVQRWGIRLGFLCLLAGGALWLVGVEDSGVRHTGVWSCLIGAVLVVSGILWGFWWRGYVRAEFRRQYGEVKRSA